jgi:hypothetical protein
MSGDNGTSWVECLVMEVEPECVASSFTVHHPSFIWGACKSCVVAAQLAWEPDSVWLQVESSCWAQEGV